MESFKESIFLPHTSLSSVSTTISGLDGEYQENLKQNWKVKVTMKSEKRKWKVKV